MKVIYKFILLICLFISAYGHGHCALNETQSVVLNSNSEKKRLESVENTFYGEYKKTLKSINDWIDNKIKTAYGQRALSMAVSRNDYEFAKFLLEHGVNTRSRFEGDNNRLGVAVAYQNVKMAKLLIDNGAEMYIEDVSSAIRSANTNLIEFMCKNGAKKFLSEQFNYGQNYCLDAAIENNNTEIVKILVKNGVNANYRNGCGMSWLASACQLGYYDTAKTLCEIGKRIDLSDGYGMAPIIWAAWYDRVEIVKLLIDKGADVNAKTVDGTSALMFAAMAGNIEVMKTFIDKGANVNSKNNNDIDAAMEAITSGQTEAVALLKSKGANIDSAFEDLEFIKKCGTNINVKNKFGANLLVVAANENNMEKVKLLIDRGAETDSQIENDESEHYGRFYGKYYEKRTALYYAVKNNNEAMVKLLVEKGALRDKIDEKYNPLLILAAANKNYNLVKYLIDKKISVNEYYQDEPRASESFTPLIKASGNVKIMDLLIKNGADVI